MLVYVMMSDNDPVMVYSTQELAETNTPHVERVTGKKVTAIVCRKLDLPFEYAGKDESHW